jgi:uncharacterized membrane protein
MTEKYNRFWELDFLRGIAIVIMIVYHFLCDLYYFGLPHPALTTGIWIYVQRISASTFLFLVGISLTISYSRAFAKGKHQFSKYLFRGLKIFSWGFAITVITWIFYGDKFIIFGVLHFIGVAIILAYPFLRYRVLNLVLGVIIVVFGALLNRLTFGFRWLIWLGFKPEKFYYLDYFPLLPWFGIVLVGVFAGNTLYKYPVRQFKLWNLEKVPFIKFFRFLGLHSLFIYLIHQPILVFILYAIGVNIGF